MPLDLSCPDWRDRLAAGRAPIPDLPLDQAAARRAVSVFDNLRLPDVVGQPRLADAAGDWVRDIVRAIFGSVDPKTGVRGVGEVFVLVPKKNSKTTSAAAIALTAMLLNQRPNADMLIVAPTQKIAEVAFEQAKGIIKADPRTEAYPEGWLSERFHVQDHRKTIRCRVTETRLMVRTFSADVLTGAKPILILVDETHELGKVPYAAEVFRELRGGMQPFPDAFMMQITTQSAGPPAGIFAAELQYARRVRDGRAPASNRLLPVLYEFPEEVQTSEDRLWQDPRLWRQVTPNMGRSISLDRLEADFDRAREDGIEELIGFATKHLNVEVGLAMHANRWRGADHWEAAGRPGLTLDAMLDQADVATIGIDGGGLDDLFGLSVVARDRRTKAWRIWARAWAHPEVLDRRKDIAAQLRAFEAQGDLVVCESATQDIEEVADVVAVVARRGLLPEAYGIGLDPYGVAALVDELAGRGITEEQMSAVRQGSALSPAVWGLERKLKDGTAVHCDQPLMAWCIGNAIAEQRGNAVLITKQTAGKAKIDPLVATFNAAMLMQRNPRARNRDLKAFLERPVMVA